MPEHETPLIYAIAQRADFTASEMLAVTQEEAERRFDLTPLGMLQPWSTVRLDQHALVYYVCDSCNVGDGKPLHELQANEANAAPTMCDSCWSRA